MRLDNKDRYYILQEKSEAVYRASLYWHIPHTSLVEGCWKTGALPMMVYQQLPFLQIARVA